MGTHNGQYSIPQHNNDENFLFFSELAQPPALVIESMLRIGPSRENLVAVI